MIKLTTMILVAGLATATTTLPSAAQFLAANIPGGPNYPVSHTDHDCADDMGHMRSVNVFDIQGIHDRKVYLHPICEDRTVYGRNNYGTLFLDGNVNVLREPIARNRTLMTALEAKGYDQYDVVSLRFGGNNSIILYVHQRDMN
ncbi:hypothetical protein [uncultured Devosia sp.]|uniref:hypothetical protein n=1 Tax=uncultured Devosia sp. TaxID=211434 RepID=UPI002627B224|nr:hypothetical protein [uncultured Devosia sp.]